MNILVYFFYANEAIHCVLAAKLELPFSTFAFLVT
jgi:hypothetical protein